MIVSFLIKRSLNSIKERRNFTTFSNLKQIKTREVNEDRTKIPPPYLPRPLGTPSLPNKTQISEKEKLQNLVNQDLILKERQHLISEVSKGYYHDWNQLRHNGNKLWTAPPSLIQEQKALYFPNVTGISLSTKTSTHTVDLFANHISLLAVESNRMSEEHTRSFYEEPMRMLSDQSNLQLIRLNIQENPLKSWLVNLFINNLKKSVPEDQHSRYLLSNQNLEYLREPLGMVNKLIGYVYLIDCNQKIRWAGCGFSNADEISALFSSTRSLLERLKKTV